MKITFCLFTEINDLPRTLNIYDSIILKIVKKYNNFTVVDFSKILKNSTYLKKDQINISKNENKFDGKLNVFSPLTNYDFISYAKDKHIFAFDALGKSLASFKIRRLVNKNNIKLILLINGGSISNFHDSSDNNLRNLLIKLSKKLTNYIYRFLVLIKYFSNVFIYFESRNKIYENCILNKKKIISKIFPFFNILYFENIYKINSFSYDRYLENKNNLKENKIVFIDGNYKHPDILSYKNFDLVALQKIYFERLENFFKWICKIFNQPVEICLHPSSDKEQYKSFFKNRIITQNSTYESIANSSVVIFHESSAFLDAILYKKKIISLNTSLLGEYISNRINYYKNQFNLVSINLDIFNSNLTYKYERSSILNDLNAAIKNYDYYIKENLITDADDKGSDKIIKILESYEKNY